MNGAYTNEVQAVMAKAPIYITPANTANAAARAAKMSVGGAGYAANGLLATRMAGRQMLLEMTGENELVQQMQDMDRAMLMVGNDLMAACMTDDNMLGNAEALGHLLDARTHWKQAVNANPNPTSTAIDCYQSGDPNDMKGYLSPSGTNHIGIGVKTLSYTIEFENDQEIANASASTIDVKSLVDSSNFDLSTLKALKLIIGDKEVALPGSHHFVKTLDMRPAINAIAELTFDFNTESGLAEWKLRSLDPLTLNDVTYMDDGILPVNDGTGRGIGYLTYSVDLLSTVANSASIESKADIVFDNNATISTPIWTNITDFTPPEAEVISAEKTDDGLSYNITVRGEDSGSGIWYYDLYGRVSGEDKWTLLMSEVDSENITHVSSEELPDMSFAVIAVDKAGNHSDESIINGILGDADENGKVDAGDAVIIRNFFTGKTEMINKTNAELTADGKIDAQDATIIRNLFLDKTIRTKMTKRNLK